MSAMKNKKNFPGLDGFVWWTGIVEGRQDPLKLGRVQVRCFGWHTESKQNIPSDELLWAHPAFAANVYQTTHVPKEGENVFGFFMDGEDGQFHSILELSRQFLEKYIQKLKDFLILVMMLM